MMSNDQLKEINGGGWGIALIVVASLIFIIGVIDGYVRPIGCN